MALLKRLLIATRNRGKIREIEPLLAEIGWVPVALDELPGMAEVEETGSTFAENALLKARAAAASSGLPALADDSGLVVDWLQGAPGVRSARFAGEKASDAENNARLLELLAGVPEPARTARFCCAMALVLPDGREWLVEGSCEGIIGREPQGQGGFGYDPIFYLPEFALTMAELEPAAKNRISHRARALARIRDILQQVQADPDGKGKA